MKGKCIWFSSPKGFGFVSDEATGTEYFCHFSSIRCKGYKQLKAEDKVEFDLEEGRGGRTQTANVVVID